ncbi:MAG: hypothetical protein WCJ28_04290, partial [Actinomycetota bacterium]
AVLALARLPWKSVLLAALIPVLLVSGCYAKNLILFGSPSTSSWAGMNISRIALLNIPPARMRQLITEHKLSTVALSPGFTALNYYPGIKIHEPHTGIKALDQFEKSKGEVNWNNEAYLQVSSALLREDIHSILNSPSHYLHNVKKSVAIWFTPTSENFILKGGKFFFVSTPTPQFQAYKEFVKKGGLVTPAMTKYLNAYDGIIGLSMQAEAPGSWVHFGGVVITPPIAQISFTEVFMELLFLIGIPWIAWERRRDKKMLAFLAYLWLVVLMVFLEASLLELGENDRFRFSLGSSLLVGGIIVIDRLLPRASRKQELPPADLVNEDQGSLPEDEDSLTRAE